MPGHPDSPEPRHSRLDDAQALITGALFIALGLLLFRQAGLLTGGTAGLAFLLHYASGWPFGVVFFALNLPFYWLAWRRLGPAFTVKTFIAVGLVSVLAETLPRWIALDHLQPAYGAVMGGMLLGTGFLMLFRHHASLGGVGILALVLQAERGWRAGAVQMAIDCTIVMLAFLIVDPGRVALSVLGAIALNMVLALNHRPGWYVAQ